MKRIFLILSGCFASMLFSFSQVYILSDGSLRGNQTGAIRVNTGYGYVDIGPKNTSYCLFSTDRTYFHFDKRVSMAGLTLTSATTYVPTSWYIYYTSASYPSLVLTTSKCGFFLGPTSPQYTIDAGTSGVIRGYNLSPTHSGSKAGNDPVDDNQIDNLYKLNGINFIYDPSEIPSYKENELKENSSMQDFYAREHKGFDPSDVEKYFPEMVYRDSAGAPGIINDEFIPLIIEALKEQKGLIEDLQKEINAQRFDLKNSTEETLMETEGSWLGQNIPNPFNTNTNIEFYLPSLVENSVLCIYDIQGKQLKSITINERGSGHVIINAYELPVGIYYYSLIADSKIVGTEKMILTD